MDPLVDKKYVLEKFSSKGGWTYVLIHKELKSKEDKIAWKKVRGTIDDFEIRKYHITSMPNISGLILPINSEIRRHLKKGVGDQVHVILYPDIEPLEIPDEMLMCLQDEPAALNFFNSLSESEQKFYLQWVYSAKKEETKIDRLAKTVSRLQMGLKLYDKVIV